MKAIFLDGCLRGRSKELPDECEQVVETRWHSTDGSTVSLSYSRCYKTTDKYYREIVINLGKPVGYWRLERTPASGIVSAYNNSVGLAELVRGQASAQVYQQNPEHYFNSGQMLNRLASFNTFKQH